MILGKENCDTNERKRERERGEMKNKETKKYRIECAYVFHRPHGIFERGKTQKKRIKKR